MPALSHPPCSPTHTPRPPRPPQDELFRLTTSGGKLSVEREKVEVETPELDPSLIFEQDPVQILDALLPLYMNSCLLRRCGAPGGGRGWEAGRGRCWRGARGRACPGFCACHGSHP